MAKPRELDDRHFPAIFRQFSTHQQRQRHTEESMPASTTDSKEPLEMKVSISIAASSQLTLLKPRLL
ncbi:hypothetical protein [Adlercreutzia equolifaciens]|uniref:hypothetical protein n=1 Tax=Adlercreutzia equolifaciens TaxID=446660 RepID=UPI00266C4B5C|nr:hypothetical protein [Adlercreutzia equolifaciens]